MRGQIGLRLVYSSRCPLLDLLDTRVRMCMLCVIMLTKHGVKLKNLASNRGYVSLGEKVAYLHTRTRQFPATHGPNTSKSVTM